MKNLIIVRSAKTPNECLDSLFDRPLSKNGKINAKLVAESVIGALPSNLTIASSPANSCMSTAKIFGEILNFDIDSVKIKDHLFADNFSYICNNHLNSIIELIDNNENVLIFIGNNTMSSVINYFGDQPIVDVKPSSLYWLKFEEDEWKKNKRGFIHKKVFSKYLKNNDRE